MIRFIAWSGHECGLHGSKYYLKDHMDIYDKTRFVLNYDIVGNTLSNYSAVGGFNDEVREKLNEITASLDLEWAVTAAPMVCDTLNFAAKEIPQITLSAGFFCGESFKEVLTPLTLSHLKDLIILLCFQKLLLTGQRMKRSARDILKN